MSNLLRRRYCSSVRRWFSIASRPLQAGGRAPQGVSSREWAKKKPQQPTIGSATAAACAAHGPCLGLLPAANPCVPSLACNIPMMHQHTTSNKLTGDKQQTDTQRTAPSTHLRELWSFLCSRRCSARSAILRVSSATAGSTGQAGRAAGGQGGSRECWQRQSCSIAKRLLAMGPSNGPAGGPLHCWQSYEWLICLSCMPTHHACPPNPAAQPTLHFCRTRVPGKPLELSRHLPPLQRLLVPSTHQLRAEQLQAGGGGVA